MKVRLILVAVALTALIAAGCGSSSSNSSSASSGGSASSSQRSLERRVDEALQCLDRDRRTVHRSGRSGGPRAAALRAVGGRQRQQVARDPRHDGAGRHAADAVDRDDQDPVDHRDARRGRGRTGGKPGGRSGRSSVRESRVGVHLRIGDAAGTGRRRQHDLLPGGPRRQRPGAAGRELHRQPSAPEGRVDRRRRRGLLAGDHEGDDPDPGEGRDQGRSRDDQRHRHRRDAVQRAVVAGDLEAELEYSGRDAAVAGRRQRSAVRPRCPAGAQEGDPVRDRRHQLAVAVPHPGHVHLDLRARHRGARPTRWTRRS